MSQIEVFTEEYPSFESYWRSIILFGKNTASYKFALAKTLLHFAEQNKTTLTLEELAPIYASHICKHLKKAERQGVSKTSKFLSACQDFNKGNISDDTLINTTVKLGFNNVLTAFHNVNQRELPVHFFINEPKKIQLTDDLFRLKEMKFDNNLPLEIESRWRLVETAWDLSIPRNCLSIRHDMLTDDLFIENNQLRRITLTSVRSALNGYQKGKCFYCFNDIDAASASDSDVDHFFPHTLQNETNDINFDGVWNLVLSCQKCNRGIGGKFAMIPEKKYLERLNKRNNFLIESHHPLRETLLAQTGQTTNERVHFLQTVDSFAINYLIHRWHPVEEFEACF